MKREEMPTWKLMHTLAAAWPKGVLSCDVLGMTGSEVFRLMKLPVQRGESTSVAQGRKCRYFVSPEQLQKFVVKKRVVNMDRPFDAVREMAKRANGVTSFDSVGGRSVKNMSGTLVKLHARGELFRVRVARGFAYFSTQEKAKAFEAERKKNEPQKGSAIPASFRLLNQPPKHEVTKDRRRVEWASLPTIIPAHVQIQRAPTPRGRYEVDGPVVGGFVSEWRTLRAA